MSKKYLVGVDVGTSGTKCVLFDTCGNALYSCTKEYPLYQPHNGWAEQNPDDWWEGVSKAIRKLLKNSDVRAEEIVGVGVDGQSWSAIALDAAGEVLCPTPIWTDTRRPWRKPPRR